MKRNRFTQAARVEPRDLPGGPISPVDSPQPSEQVQIRPRLREAEWLEF